MLQKIKEQFQFSLIERKRRIKVVGRKNGKHVITHMVCTQLCITTFTLTSFCATINSAESIQYRQ